MSARTWTSCRSTRRTASGQAEAQLPDAVKREGVVVNRSSPDILMVLGLYSPKGSYDAVFLGNYCDINLVDAIKRVSRRRGREELHRAGLLHAHLAASPISWHRSGSPLTDIAERHQGAERAIARRPHRRRTRPARTGKPIQRAHARPAERSERSSRKSSCAPTQTARK